jgi:pyruvate dehydrogenase E2 component (dihydrolipoamide acetyltransferase)
VREQEETAMAIEIKMPRLSQTTDEVRLLHWLVREGDTVQKGDPLCEVETDKVTMEVEVFQGGTVLKLVAETDTVIDAGTVIALIGEKGERLGEQIPPSEDGKEASPSVEGAAHPAGPPSAEAARDRVPPDQSGESAAAPATTSAAPSSYTGDGARATRLVRNIARKRGIDLSGIRGTGPRGIITKADLEAYVASGSGKAAGTAAQAGASGGRDAAPLTSHQRAVAHSLSRSFMETPHFYLKTDLVSDRIVAWRERHAGPDGRSIAVDTFFLFAVSRVLGEMPRLNGYYRKDSFIPLGSVGINIAIASGEELYAPLLRDVQMKSIEEIDAELRELAKKTREHRLEREDVVQGSFTVTNLGMFPIDEFGAVINPPQSGILSVGRMKKALLVGPDDTMGIHTVCTLTGSFDHRIVNGTQGAAFMHRIQEILEGLDIS